MEFKKKLFPDSSGYALKVALVYFVFGILWIIITGEALQNLTNNLNESHEFEKYKGMFFVLVTGSLLYVLIRSMERAR